LYLLGIAKLIEYRIRQEGERTTFYLCCRRVHHWSWAALRRRCSDFRGSRGKGVRSGIRGVSLYASMWCQDLCSRILLGL